MPHAPAPSTTYQRLRHYIAKRMRISHIYQPLMLMELLGRSTPSARKDDASPFRPFQPPGGLMEPINASLQRGRQG